jgi:outer membrane protein assembly factor BamB
MVPVSDGNIYSACFNRMVKCSDPGLPILVWVNPGKEYKIKGSVSITAFTVLVSNSLIYIEIKSENH